MGEILVGAVPVGWDSWVLGDLCKQGGGDIQTGPFGSQLHASDYVSIGVPSVMPQNIGDNVIAEDGISQISEKDADRLSRYLLREGDIVYSRRGDVERRALVRAEQDGWLCGTGCLRVRPGFAIDSRYLAYYLGHPESRAWVVRHAIGATMPNLNTKILSALPVIVPPMAVQKAIAEVLGALDDKIAVNEKVAGKALELAEAIYLKALGASDGWENRPLRDVASWYSGGTPRTSEPTYWGGNVPWISAASLKSPWISASDRNLTDEGVKNGTRIVPKGTIIFVVRGMSLKSEFRIGVTRREVAFGQDCKALVPIEGVDSYFLFHSLNSRREEVLGLVDEAGHGTGRLATDRLVRIKVRIPPPDSSLSSHLRSLTEIGAQRQEENQKLSELRDTLLPKLVSGQIHVKDFEKPVSETV